MTQKEKERIVLDYLRDPNNSIGMSNRIFMDLTKSKSRATFGNLRSRLESNGIHFKKNIINGVEYYSLESENETFIPSHPKDCRAFILKKVMSASPSGITKKNNFDLNTPCFMDFISLAQEGMPLYTEDVEHDNYSSYDKIALTCGKTTFDNLLEDFSNNGEVLKCLLPRNILSNSKTKNSYVYLPTIKSSNYSCRFSESNLTNLYQWLYTLPISSKNTEIIEKIKTKVSICLGNSDLFQNNSNFLIQGKKFLSLEDLHSRLELLTQHDFQHRRLHIEFTDQSNSENDSSDIEMSNGSKNNSNKGIVFSVGLIVYSEMDDDIILLGKKHADKNGSAEYQFIKYSSIESIADTEYANTTNKFFYKNNQKYMLGASTKQPTKVKLQLNNRFNIKEQIDALKTNRSNATPTLYIMTSDNHNELLNYDEKNKLSNEQLIYEDTISDTEMYMQHILSFGRACKVIEPKELQNMIKEDIESSLENYRKAGYNIDEIIRNSHQ